ncbi:hypothetical protein LCGC14_1832130 [marine sediment metagenome]|uniref:Uncharacterized protein n=1 Tax=marine sediment metagenome TaxID=412755 RepID=A0A0F9GFQ3_9ZZZZ
MAKEAGRLDEELRNQVPDVTGQDVLSIEGATEVYQQSTFEERLQMFYEVFGTDGPDGLEFLRDVFTRAQDEFLKGMV